MKKTGLDKKLSVYSAKLKDKSGRMREKLGRRKNGPWKRSGGKDSTLKKWPQHDRDATLLGQAFTCLAQATLRPGILPVPV